MEERAEPGREQPGGAEPAGAAADAPRRPVIVSVAVVVLIVLAGFGALEGASILLMRYDELIVQTGLVLAVSLAGAVGILLSLLLGTLAAAVWRGSRAARIAVTVFSAGALLLDIVTLTGSSEDLWWTVIDAVPYLFVVGALWIGRRTNAYFRRRPAPAGAAAAA